ncbi:MAG: transporter related protein [Acidimicrobiaceae bacterium]|jgi:multiple sugar transport system ATP-binding protein|nr:transporter related protein [Acidimicrobiaceae bacterium]
MAEITFDRVTKVYPDGTSAVSELSLDIADGEFVVLVGPSGCGKTTALRMVAGLEEISRGELRIGGRVANHMLPRGRDIAMVFQNYALYPQKSVYNNMAFALKIRNVPKDEIDRRVREAARILGLTQYLERKPKALSGGQRQRVAMGRAIVREPQAFLMDEPLSNLDAKLRVDMRAEIARIQRMLGATTIYVTHDQVEAMTMGDRVAVMRGGILQQVDAPERLYEQPANLFVASFIGSPAMNLVEASLEAESGRLHCRFGDSSLAVSDICRQARPEIEAYAGRRVVVGFRSEDITDATSAPEAGADRRLKAVIEVREALGSEILAHFSLGEERAGLALAGDVIEEQDGGASSPRSRRFVARLGPRAPVREGERAELVVDTDRLHFFDPESGLALGRSRT